MGLTRGGRAWLGAGCGVCGAVVDTAPQPPTTPPPLHPTIVWACHASPTPPARCLPLPNLWILWGEGEAGVLPANLCPVQPWVCGWGPPTQPRHPRSHRCVSLPCVPGPSRMLFATLLCIWTAGRGQSRGVTCQHAPTTALGGDCAAGHPPHPATHTRSHRGVCPPCIPDLTRTLSPTLLYM